ncbi:Serine protease AprX [Halalkalibacter krulwichiae]|uniref:Serine protease AprX n=1 Tax=Halalkalibacter krulwichiae TaxID=199441 RepID=A0A1X9MBN2_9BACI|nr:Serine protease AprX [Halalkalibacter krulwichiae]
MFGYSMVQMVRSHAEKIDRPLRDQILNLYKPFKWTPCIFHRLFEGWIQKTKKLSVIIQFEKNCFDEGCMEVEGVFANHMRCKLEKRFTSVSCCSATLTPSALEELLPSCKHIKMISHNREVQALLDTAVPSANAENIMRNGTELSGQGVVALLLIQGFIHILIFLVE